MNNRFVSLSVARQKVAWSIADYLATLEKSVGDLLKAEDKRESKPKPAPPAAAKAGE